MRPSLYRQKIRKLELAIGGTRQRGKKLPDPAFLRPGDQRRHAEAELVAGHEAAYRRLVADWQATRPAKKKGAGATPGRASSGPSKGKAARQATSP